jgi:hypothetical protein
VLLMIPQGNNQWLPNLFPQRDQRKRNQRRYG